MRVVPPKGWCWGVIMHAMKFPTELQASFWHTMILWKKGRVSLVLSGRRCTRKTNQNENPRILRNSRKVPGNSGWIGSPGRYCPVISCTVAHLGSDAEDEALRSQSRGGIRRLFARSMPRTIFNSWRGNVSETRDQSKQRKALC